jgi:hypothetical protein
VLGSTYASSGTSANAVRPTTFGHLAETMERSKVQKTIFSTSIDNTSPKDRSHFDKQRLMLISNNRTQLFTELNQLTSVSIITLLHVNHRSSQ